jgi:hypothetical protein
MSNYHLMVWMLMSYMMPQGGKLVEDKLANLVSDSYER